MIKLKELAVKLNMDKSNLHKIVKRLNISGTKIRGTNNKWSIAFNDEQIEQILKYREGIPHNLVKEEGHYI